MSQPPPSDPDAPLTKGNVVVVEGVIGGRPRAFVVQGLDARGRWKLKLLGDRRRRNLANQTHGATVLIDGAPFTVTGHNANHLRVEPILVGVRAARIRVREGA